ncbi:MAG: MFS transporter, partial [Chloroflexota bacterium]
MNRNLLFIAIALFTWGIGEGMFFNFQPIYLAELGSDPQEIGFILGAFGAAMAVTHIPAGHLADRLGRRPLLVSAWTMGLLSTLVMAMARDLPLFVVGMLGYGLTAFVASPLSSYTTAARGNWSVA